MGLYHNAGPLPWDDDVDVVMTEEDALELIALVERKKAFPFFDEIEKHSRVGKLLIAIAISAGRRYPDHEVLF